ncbi:MAG: hypothetical protein HRU09_12190 [Oligoflexales bacterium]|nr:hypothetical protein [Oligoflexales bacterium]
MRKLFFGADSLWMLIIISLQGVACQSMNHSKYEKSSHTSIRKSAKKLCSKVIRSYIFKAKDQYKFKKMVVRKTNLGIFVVPSKSLMTYMFIMKPSDFDRIYGPKHKDQKFYCMKEGRPFKGVYHLYPKSV